MDLSHKSLPSSAYWLIGANLFPLLGVLFLGWSTFSIVFIYWCENVILGAINLLKMLSCAPDTEALAREQLGSEQLGSEQLGPEELGSQTEELLEKFQGNSRTLSGAHHLAKLFFMPFFAVHYGMFCFVHGVFVFVLLSGDGPFASGAGGGGITEPFDVIRSSLSTLTQQHLWWAVLALAGSHLYSFFTNYLGKGEYRKTVLPKLMSQPYGRVVILHVALLFGAFLLMMIGSPILLLLILIVGKTALDLKLHLREHQQEAQPQPTSGGVA